MRYGITRTSQACTATPGTAATPVLAAGPRPTRAPGVPSATPQLPGGAAVLRAWSVADHQPGTRQIPAARR